MGVAAHVNLTRGAADKDRDRLERELGVLRDLGGFDALGLRGLGERKRVGGASCFVFASDLAASTARAFLGFGGRLLLHVLGLRPWLRRAWQGGERLLGISELGFGASLGIFELAHRRRGRGRLALCGRDSALRGGRRLGGLVRLAGSFSARAGAASIASCFGTNSEGWEKSTGSASLGEMITRIPIGALSNSFSATSKGIRTQPCEAA